MIGNGGTPIVAFLSTALLGLLFYGAIFFCVWKFYELVSKINDNLAGIREALELRPAKAPEE